MIASRARRGRALALQRRAMGRAMAARARGVRRGMGVPVQVSCSRPRSCGVAHGGCLAHGAQGATAAVLRLRLTTPSRARRPPNRGARPPRPPASPACKRSRAPRSAHGSSAAVWSPTAQDCRSHHIYPQKFKTRANPKFLILPSMYTPKTSLKPRWSAQCHPNLGGLLQALARSPLERRQPCPDKHALLLPSWRVRTLIPAWASGR